MAAGLIKTYEGDPIFIVAARSMGGDSIHVRWIGFSRSEAASSRVDQSATLEVPGL